MYFLRVSTCCWFCRVLASFFFRTFRPHSDARACFFACLQYRGVALQDSRVKRHLRVLQSNPERTIYRVPSIGAASLLSPRVCYRLSRFFGVARVLRVFTDLRRRSIRVCARGNCLRMSPVIIPAIRCSELKRCGTIANFSLQYDRALSGGVFAALLG